MKEQQLDKYRYVAMFNTILEFTAIMVTMYAIWAYNTGTTIRLLATAAFLFMISLATSMNITKQKEIDARNKIIKNEKR